MKQHIYTEYHNLDKGRQLSKLVYAWHGFTDTCTCRCDGHKTDLCSNKGMVTNSH